MESNNTIYKNKYIFIIFVWICYFPWINILKFPSEIQPNSLIIGVLILIISLKITSLSLNIIFFLAVPFLNFLLSDFSILAARGFGAYCSFAVVYIIFFNFYKYQKDNKKTIIKIILIYFIAALIQLFYDPNFFTGILSREIGYGGFQGRGVESLTAEPTFFAIHLSFLLLVYNFRSNGDKFINLFTLIAIIFLAKSSTVLVTGFVTLLALLILRKKFMVIIFTIITSLFLINNMSEEIRFIKLAKDLININTDIIYLDQSLFVRFHEIVVSIYGFIESPIIGNGYTSFSYSLSTYPRTDDLPVNLEANRVSSFIGGIAYENGILPLIIILTMIYKTAINYSNDPTLKFVIGLYLLLILFQSVPLSYPLIAILFAKASATSQLKYK